MRESVQKAKSKLFAEKREGYLRECPTRKVRFKSHESALTRAGQILDEGARGTNYFRAYRCEYCGGYHLSKTM
jgi:hypothetical protein